MSDKSGRRLIFALDNSPKDWGVMTTHTFRERVVDGRVQMNTFQKYMTARGFGDLHFAWVREYQGRGAVHYHCLWEREGLDRRGLLAEKHLEAVTRKGKERKLVRGPFESHVVEAWMAATREQSDEFKAFQWGGICELLTFPDGASRYFASYVGKPEQKTVPEDAEVNGRWWYVGKAAKPVPMSDGHLTAWNQPIPLNTVWNKFDLAEHYTLADQGTYISETTRQACRNFLMR